MSEYPHRKSRGVFEDPTISDSLFSVTASRNKFTNRRISPVKISSFCQDDQEKSPVLYYSKQTKNSVDVSRQKTQSKYFYVEFRNYSIDTNTDNSIYGYCSPPKRNSVHVVLR